MYDILEQLCNERGVAITKLCKDVTGSSGNLSTWKKGYMRSDYLKKVAEILNVSADYLLGRTEQKNASMNNGSVINSGSNNNIQNGNNIINSNNNNITQSDNNQKSLDETSVQVAEMFQNLDIQNKAKVLSYMIEVTK